MRARLLAAAGLALGFGATFAIRPWSNESITDLPLFHSLATSFTGGALPYRDVPFEYPPLAAPLLALPELAADYRLGFAALVLALALAALLLTGRLARLTGGDERIALGVVALAPLLTGATIRTHFDLAPVVLTLGALVLVLSRRPALGFALLGAGAMTKLFPLAAAPVALAWLVGRGERRAALRGALALLVTVAALAGAAAGLSPDGALDAVRYQADRPVQVESGPATALRAVAALGGEPLRAVESHRSDGVVHPAADLVTALFAGALAGLVGLLALAAARRPDARALVLASLTAIAGFALLGKVLSPQFMVWLIPLMALAAAWRMWALAGAVAVASALTLAEFPGLYFDMVAARPGPVALVVARNVVLVAAVALAALSVGRDEQLLDRARAPVVARLD